MLNVCSLVDLYLFVLFKFGSNNTDLPVKRTVAKASISQLFLTPTHDQPCLNEIADYAVCSGSTYHDMLCSTVDIQINTDYNLKFSTQDY